VVSVNCRGLCQMPTQQSRQSSSGGKKMESRTEEAKVELLVVGEMVLGSYDDYMYGVRSFLRTVIRSPYTPCTMHVLELPIMDD
jgi:hypothetical protein